MGRVAAVMAATTVATDGQLADKEASGYYQLEYFICSQCTKTRSTGQEQCLSADPHLLQVI